MPASILRVLMSHWWPGNVRELENCIQQLVAINTGPLIHVGDLPSPIRNSVQTRKGVAFSMAAGAAGGARKSLPLAKPARHPKIPIIAQTAYTLSEDRHKCMEAGFNDYIAKPINRVALFRLVNDNLS